MRAAPRGVTAEEIRGQLHEQGFGLLPFAQAEQLKLYLDLLLKWRQKISLTSIHNEEEIVSRHFGESLVCADHLPGGAGSLLDFGSGAGFPGVPCAIRSPSVQVTLAEADARKSAFLREVQRTLDLRLSIYTGRVEAMPKSSNFDCVTLRAVEQMQKSCLSAVERLRMRGSLIVLTTARGLGRLQEELSGLTWEEPIPIPGSLQRILVRGRRIG